MTEANGRLLARIVEFAERSGDALFLGLIGSNSNGGGLGDEYSDIDLVLVTDDVRRYFGGSEWLGGIGEVWFTFTESAPEINHFERRCVFGGGLDVDFVVVDAAALARGEDFPVLADICLPTMRTLVDKGGFRRPLERFVRAERPPVPPSAEEFANVVGDFFFHYLWCVKKCLRGELWVAARCADGYMKDRTLRLLEWRARSLGREAFHDGRYVERWAGESVRERFAGIFAGYGRAEILSALDESRSLFEDVARAVAEGLGFPFPGREAGLIAARARELCAAAGISVGAGARPC